jgi:F-type H+-transporting ATPase subunit a
MTIILVIGSGIKFKSFKGWVKSLFEPMPFMFPLNVLEYFIKPLSLCMRLFGNIFAAYVLMHMIIKNIPLIFPSIACIYFDLFDGGLQAFVFVFLSTLYIAEEVEMEE